MKRTIMLTALVFAAACGARDGDAPPPPAAAGPAGAAALAEGESIPLPDGGRFSWKFSEKPKLGVAIVNLQAYGPGGEPDTSYGLVGEYGMPTMRYHDSGPKPFILSKKGHYLLPVEFTMPGEWEIVIRVSRDGKEIYEGRKLLTI